MPIGSSSSIRTGASVVALGNAEGQGSITAAAGHVTGLNQDITVSDEGGSVSLIGPTGHCSREQLAGINRLLEGCGLGRRVP